MALSIATYSYGEDSSGVTTKTVTQPTGLSLNDRMIAIVRMQGQTGDRSNIPTGWTKLSTSAIIGTGDLAVIFTKIADSSDVAASDFTFTFTANVKLQIALLRVIDSSLNNDIDFYSVNPSVVTTTKTPSISNTITPFTDSLIIMVSVVYLSENSAGTLSSYSIETSSPTFTELLDESMAYGSSTLILGIASGIRTQNTATGNSSFTVTTSSANATVSNNCLLISIPANKNYTNTETITMSEVRSSTIKFSNEDTLSLSENYLYSIGRVWNKVTKPITTWINKPKN